MSVFEDDVTACTLAKARNRGIGILQMGMSKRAESFGMNIPPAGGVG